MTDVMTHMLGREPHKIFYGQHAERGYMRLFIQDCGSRDGKPLHMVAGVLMLEDDSLIPTRDDGTSFRDAEMWICEVIIRPVERYRDTDCRMIGMGLDGAVTGQGLDKTAYATRVFPASEVKG